MNKIDIAEADALASKTAKDEERIHTEPSEEFVNSSYVQELTQRALAYLEVGYPVHLSGPSGTGKTTLAFHIANQIGQPVTLIHGDDEFGSSDLVGRDSGLRKSKVVDNYIHTVLRTEEEWDTSWQDNRLTVACKRGYTLIYDEFTRSRPEANNALLSVLEERILNLPKLQRRGDAYIEVSPKFRAIFTSNPQEYVGVHKTQDALMDRLVTIKLSHFNRDNEIQIAISKSGIKREDAEKIVDLVREVRTLSGSQHRPTIRGCIAIAKVSMRLGCKVVSTDQTFRNICHDILNLDALHQPGNGKAVTAKTLDEVIARICKNPKRSRSS